MKKIAPNVSVMVYMRKTKRTCEEATLTEENDSLGSDADTWGHLQSAEARLTAFCKKDEENSMVSIWA